MYLISAEDFDKLHVYTLYSGGIGAGCRYQWRVIDEIDQILAVDVIAHWNDSNISKACPFDFSENDQIVRSINRKKGKKGMALNDRVSFLEFVKAAGLDIAEDAS